MAYSFSAEKFANSSDVILAIKHDFGSALRFCRFAAREGRKILSMSMTQETQKSSLAQ